jgi:DNA mismatch endonuclease (patch repair protein)
MAMRKTKKEPMDRSAVMRRVRSTDTAPELAVRKLLFSLGFRYRLHYSKLPGKPDIVFPRRKKVIFVNGCFWHGHNCKRGDRLPSTNVDYWQTKLASNKERDKNNYEKLNNQGFELMIVWECELKDMEALRRNLIRFINT